MNEGDICKTAVQTPLGMVEYRFMNFGLKCASQTFQQFMDQIMRNKHKNNFSYIDDIIVHSRKEDHDQVLRDTFRTLDENGTS